MRAWLMAVVLVGCGAGANPETLIDDLRVVASVAEPPELGPGEATTVTATVADPLMRGFDVLTWSCTRLGPSCAEAEAADLDTWASVVSDAALQSSTEREASGALAAVLGDDLPALDVEVWTLACEPGLCPVIDAVRDRPAPGSAAWTELADDLALPTTWLAELPLDGVSLAARTVRVSLAAPEDRHANPTLTVTTAIGQDSELEVDVSVVGDSAATLYGYSTSGGFGAAAVQAVDGLANLTWYAAEEPAPAALYVVAQDDLGGTAVWVGDAP